MAAGAAGGEGHHQALIDEKVNGRIRKPVHDGHPVSFPQRLRRSRGRRARQARGLWRRGGAARRWVRTNKPSSRATRAAASRTLGERPPDQPGTVSVLCTCARRREGGAGVRARQHLRGEHTAYVPAAARRRGRAARRAAARCGATHLVQDCQPRERSGNRLADAASNAAGQHHAQRFVVCGGGGGGAVSTRRAVGNTQAGVARARRTRRRCAATRVLRTATRRGGHVGTHPASRPAALAAAAAAAPLRPPPGLQHSPSSRAACASSGAQEPAACARGAPRGFRRRFRAPAVGQGYRRCAACFARDIGAERRQHWPRTRQP